MENYKKRLAGALAETGALFFDKDLVLKDGRPTPYFVNLGMFRTGRLSMELGSFFADMMVDRDLINGTDIILGPSYKGSAIALATSISLYVHHGYDLFFEYDRKEVKTHGEGSKSKSISVNRTLFDGCRVFIVDDVATSMGTKHDLLKRLRMEAESNNISIDVIGIGIAIDREQNTAVYDNEGKVIPDSKGENAIGNFVAETKIPVYSVAGIREVIDYLYQEKVPVLINGNHKPFDAKTKSEFDDYLKIYGNN
ncbi:orotate phosphoribosyltransferase [Thermodesulfobacteriota bacterium]